MKTFYETFAMWLTGCLISVPLLILFMFGINFGYEIKNGKLGKAILDTTVSGVAFEMLKTVDMVSDSVIWNTSGTCGKKQYMAVSMGGPAIKCKISIGGR